MKWKELFTRAVKFCVTGGLNTIIDLCVTTLLNSVLKLPLFVAQIIGCLAGMTNSFITNKHWTFRTGRGNIKSELWKFLVVNFGVLGLKLMLTYELKQVLPFGDFVINLIATAVMIAISFPLNNFWVFKKK